MESDIVYACVGERELLLDLYLPVDAPRPLPVVVWVHGGGWRSGSKGNVDWALGLLSRGFAIVDVDYRWLQGQNLYALRNNLISHEITVDNPDIKGGSYGNNRASGRMPVWRRALSGDRRTNKYIHLSLCKLPSGGRCSVRCMDDVF